MAQSTKHPAVQSYQEEAVELKIKAIKDGIGRLTSSATDAKVIGKVNKIQERFNKILNDRRPEEEKFSDLERLWGDICAIEFAKMTPRVRIPPLVAILIGLALVGFAAVGAIVFLVWGISSMQSGSTGIAVELFVFSGLWGLGWGITGILFIFKIRSMAVQNRTY